MEDLEKTLRCVKVFHLLVDEESSESDVKALIKKSLGPGWSIVSVAQFLTGKAALGSLESLPSNFEFEGLNKLSIGLLMTTAHEFCANALASGPISNGIKVGNFAKDSGLTDLEKLKSIFSSKKSLN